MKKTYTDVEDLEVYQRLCKLHIEVCDLSHKWPQEERYELGSQVRRSSNSSPAQLAEKHDDRHIRFDPEPTTEAQSILARQHQVQHHQVEPRRRHQLGHGAPVAGGVDAVAMLFQESRQQVANLGIVVDDEYVRGLGHDAC